MGEIKGSDNINTTTQLEALERYVRKQINKAFPACEAEYWVEDVMDELAPTASMAEALEAVNNAISRAKGKC